MSSQLELSLDLPRVPIVGDYESPRSTFVRPAHWGAVQDYLAECDEIVDHDWPDFRDILYDFRLGQVWHRVLATSATEDKEAHLTIGSYKEPLPECDPVYMELWHFWEFPLDWTPGQVIRAIKDGAEPCWTNPDFRDGKWYFDKRINQ